jgi:cytochrome d ubiquinol oxidase subunit I
MARARWYFWAAVWTIPLPFIASLAGWVLTEVGRQPWIVYGLLRTSDANSPSVSATWLGISLGTFALLYAALTVTDIVLLRRYADPDRPVPTEAASSAVSY